MTELLNPSPKSNLRKYPEGSVFQGFGESPEGYARFGYLGHNGWDILAYEGAPLVACANGVIYQVATIGDSEKDNLTKYNGNALWLLTDEIGGKRYYIAYGHCKDVFVKEGQRVTAGEKIATMGNTGFVVSGGVSFWNNAPAGKGVHLHLSIYEVTVFGNTINYLNYDNGYKGAIDPAPFFSESIKAEISDARIPLLLKIRELYRLLIRAKGQEPVA